MSASEKRPGSITFLLVGVTLTTLIGTALVLPILPCPEYCFDTGTSVCPPCPTCTGLERVSVWKQLRMSPEERGMEGRVISQILFFDFRNEQLDQATRALGLRSGDRFTKNRMLNASYRLQKISVFKGSVVDWAADPVEPNKIVIFITKSPSNPKGESQSTFDEDKVPEVKK